MPPILPGAPGATRHDDWRDPSPSTLAQRRDFDIGTPPTAAWSLTVAARARRVGAARA
jgi:hypothetical protein